MSPASDAPSAIGRYRIDGLLGRGAMGVVYRAYDPEIDRPVAIKLVRADLLGGESREEYLRRFRREAQAAGRCSHPNIVGLHDVSADAAGNPFLVMEYVHGTSLDRLMANGQVFDAAQVTIVGLQVLDALACAHGLGVVHRDVKPANILLPDATQAHLRVKVTDFGISRIVANDITQVGMVIGTPSYMSPEQCLGDDVGPQSDLFSVASVIYEMLTGRKAFAGSSIGRLTVKLVQEVRPPIPGLAPPLQALLDRAHAKRPEERFPSAAAMADALRQTMRAANPSAPATAAETIMLQPASSRGAMPIEPGVAREVERLLAAYVGPFTRHLVQRAFEQASSADAFARSLAAAIDDPAQQEAFLRQARTALRGSASAFSGSGQSRGAERQPAASTISAEACERVARDLARHLGPIASHLVRRAATSVASVEQLRAALAAQIDDEADRREFLAGR